MESLHSANLLLSRAYPPVEARIWSAGTGVILDTTTKSLEIILASAVTTNQLPFIASFMELSSNSSTAAPKNTDGASNSTSAVTAIAAPANSSLVRLLLSFSLYNADTVNATVTVRLNDNSTTRIICKSILSVGDTLAYDPSAGWYVQDSLGSRKQAIISSLSVGESGITLSDVTTDDVSITKHGFAPKAPNDANKYLDGTGNYAYFSGMTASDPAFADLFPEYNAAAAANRSTTFARLAAFLAPNGMGGRLSLTSGSWVTSADVTAALVLYHAVGGNGTGGTNRTIRSDGTRLTMAVFTELSIKATDSAQTGTMTSGNKIISGLTSTAQLVRGMQITGTSVGASSVIATIDSATQVTGTVNSTGSTTNAVTFKLPPSKVYDVFDVNGVLQFGNSWSADTTRTDALGTLNGTTVNNAAISSGDSNAIAAKAGVWLGYVATTATAGQLEDSITNRLVVNGYNRLDRPLQLNPGYSDANSATTTTNASTTWSLLNGGTGDTATYLSDGENAVDIAIHVMSTNAQAGQYNAAGIGDDSTTTAYVVGFDHIAGNGQLCGPLVAIMRKIKAAGRHTASMLFLTSGNTATIYLDFSRNGATADVRGTNLAGIIKG